MHDPFAQASRSINCGLCSCDASLHPIGVQLDDIQRAAQEQFGRQSQHYVRGHVLENVEDVAAALERINLPPGAPALDVATGAGHTGLFLASRGFDATLSDVAQPMLDRARELAEQRGLRAQFRQHSAESLPYADASFRLVTCRVAPHHFSSPEKFVGEASRVLAPGGYFLLIDGTVEDDQAEAEEWMHQVEKLRDPSHNRLLTPRQWSDLCRKSGLNVEHLEVTSFKQPDLNWFFEAANTPPANRERVLEIIRNPPESARRIFRLGEEDGKIIWWWQRLTLIARKNA